MSDETKDGGAVERVSDPSENDSSVKTINPDDHKRALNDMLKYKQMLKDSQGTIETLQSQIDAINRKSLQEKEDFKGLYETTQSKLSEEMERNKKLQSAFLYSERHRAVFPALKKEGFRDDAQNLLDMLDLSDVDVEATSEGRFLVNGVDSWVESFKAKYPYAFAQKKAPLINTGTGGDRFTPQSMTPSRLLEIEAECKKTGDKAPYYSALAEYRKNKK